MHRERLAAPTPRSPVAALAAAALLACVPLALADGGAPVGAKSPLPCIGPEFHQFDFWIGEGNVTTLDGKHAGWNLIKRELGGCVLTESWTGASGSIGRSFNISTPTDGKWHQTWVDSRGLLLQLTGGLVDGDMVMTGDTLEAQGRRVMNRITWHKIDDDHVRQIWDQSNGNGAMWTVVFLGVYSRKQL